MTADVFCITGITQGFTAAMDEFASPLGLAIKFSTPMHTLDS
jgi:hypothetical protein